ncbi:type I restriction endonuclease subunit R [Micrococcus lylae]|uniref:type I restriction endonuclease subunit R n=1 Tax=Micrococcus lylae TaxID=1273 RepID=UPI0021A4BC07|nr:type I restriction endonuclease subunit R [Micrococcus lylae]MCT2006810.1 type I restriction endonuclease subunit R [Micrococcus lylae]MCT2070630.1 type I restriction endonuclease subunit R [Micrococcus lylae]
MAGFGMNEDQWEQDAMEILATVEWAPLRGQDVAPGSGERTSWEDPVLHKTLISSLRRLNPTVPVDFLHQAAAEVLAPKSQDVLAENFRIHQVLVHGYKGITYVDTDGEQHNPTIRFLSADAPRNTHHAVNQVIVRNRDVERRFDVVLYVNGLPLAVIELKKAASLNATAEGAYNQLRTYVSEFPGTFQTVTLVVASDGLTARYGTPFTPWHHFAPWNVDDDGGVVAFGELDLDGEPATELSLTLQGLFNIDRFGQLLRDYIAFDESDAGLTKRIAKPHQYFAVSKAVGNTVDAVAADGRIGVVWHTQGSGKSMEMELYTAKVMRHERLGNPTVVVITDRTELDTQLFDGFQVSTLLPERPVQVGSREQLRDLLTQSNSGGIYFTTLQKFGLTQAEKDAGADHPVLSERRNIIVIADEAHRSHYDALDGYAAHLKNALPNASLIAFTGTPIAEGDRDTRRVFGDDIDVYDLHRAVEDGATVPVSFEPRLIKLARLEGVDDEALDAAADELTVGMDEVDRDRLQRSVAALETIYGAPQRLETLADDLVKHWEDRRDAMRPDMGNAGKAMVVCATRSICARLYEKIVERRPDWHDPADDKGKIKVVYTANPTDTDEIKVHMRRPSATAAVKKRLKDPNDELEIVIVKDMMLTGFDAPALHTLYVDRPLKGALLMQTLARVNRTYRGKQDGLLVAYAPLTENLQKALAEFTQDTRKKGTKTLGQTAAEAAEIVRELVAELEETVGVDWKATFTSDDRRGWQKALLQVTARLRSPSTPGNVDPENPNARPVADAFRTQAGRLQRAWSLSMGVEELESLRLEVKFYEEARVWLTKLDAQERIARGEPIPDEIARLLGDIVVDSTEATGVMDIYAEAGLERPRLDALTPAWAEQASKDRSAAELAIEGLRADLLKGTSTATRGNTVRKAQFSERINALMTRYTNQQLTAAEVIAELVEMAKEVAAETDRGKRFTPPLEDDELMFYDVVAQNESAVDVMGDDKLAQIARELVDTMRRDVRTDWTVREDVKAKLRSSIRRLLRKYGYPPDQQREAIVEVMRQMEAIAPRMAGAASH